MYEIFKVSRELQIKTPIIFHHIYGKEANIKKHQ